MAKLVQVGPVDFWVVEGGVVVKTTALIRTALNFKERLEDLGDMLLEERRLKRRYVWEEQGN
jgi:hypothetical protein